MTSDPQYGVAGPRGETPRIWTAANVITTLRILMILPFVWFVREGRFGAALVIFLIASVTDFLDGYLARRFQQYSTIGRFLDPAADKLLTTVGFVTLAISREGLPSLPAWLAVGVVGRDILIIGGALIVYSLTKYTGFKPKMAGKVNTVIELGLIIFFLFFNVIDRLTGLLPLCYVIVAGSVLVSGIVYVAEGVRIVRNHGAR
jgi:cardiolipin synthase